MSAQASEGPGGPLKSPPPANRIARVEAHAQRVARLEKVREVVTVVGAIGLRVTARKRTALARLFELGRARWNDLCRALAAEGALDSLPRDEEGRPRPVRWLAPWVRDLAPRDPAFPVRLAEGVEERVASALWGRHRATSRLAGRVRWVLEQDDLARAGSATALGEDGQPRERLALERRRELEAKLAALEADPLREALPRPKLTPQESRANWLAWLAEVTAPCAHDGAHPQVAALSRAMARVAAHLATRLDHRARRRLLALYGRRRRLMHWLARRGTIDRASIAGVSAVEANRRSIAAYASSDPPPLVATRGRDAPAVLSPRGVPVLAWPAAPGDGGTVALAGALHPAWAACGVTSRTATRALALPLTARGRARQRDLRGELVRVVGRLPHGAFARATLVVERRGHRDCDVRYRLQLALRRPAPPEIETTCYLAVWWGLFPRVEAILCSARGGTLDVAGELTTTPARPKRGSAVRDAQHAWTDMTPLLDDVREAMRVATLDAGPRRHGDHAHVSLRGLTHQVTTRLVRLAVEKRATLILPDVARRREHLIRRCRIPGEGGRRYRWVASSWNHALLEEQIRTKCIAVGLPPPALTRVGYYECPACGLGGSGKARRRTDAAHAALVADLRKSSWAEYRCDGCGHRETWLRSRARTVACSWLRSQGAKRREGS